MARLHKEKEKITYSGKDEKMDSIGVPINPHSSKLGSPYLTKDPKFMVVVFILVILIIALIIYLSSNN